MKRLGLIAGIGPESTIEYYRNIIKRFRKVLSTDHYPEIVLHSIDMTQMLDFVYRDDLNGLVEFLKSKIELLEDANVQIAALASNTPHLVFDQLKGTVDLELISIVEETCSAIDASGLKRVGLLGTKSTMSKGFYQQVARRHGIEMVVPGDKDQDYVHDKYMNELVFNQIIPATKAQLLNIINQLDEIEGIVLGGTELPLILQQSDFEKLIVFDTTRIHVNAIVDHMIA